MRRQRLSADDGGAAAIEFLLVGLIMLVPLFYLVVTLSQIQSHALGVESASRHIARVIASPQGDADSRQAVAAVVAAAEREYGIRRGGLGVSVACQPPAASCPQPGAVVRVVVRADVPLPLVPPLLGLDRLSAVPVEATGVQRVARTAVVDDPGARP